MYLFELKGKLPKKADKATLHWEKGFQNAVRQGVVIHLPNEPTASFYSLQDGRQFLFGYNRNYWFGGTDEEPFLVQMEAQAINNYIQGAGLDDSFYQGLVPRTISRIANETGTPYRRQGDIFASRFCGNDSFIKNLERLISYGGNGIGINLRVNQGSFNLLGTRHEGKGTIVELGNNRQLFSGVVRAPDHAPMLLDDGLYLIDQTQYIVNPTKAD